MFLYHAIYFAIGLLDSHKLCVLIHREIFLFVDKYNFFTYSVYFCGLISVYTLLTLALCNDVFIFTY